MGGDREGAWDIRRGEEDIVGDGGGVGSASS